VVEALSGRATGINMATCERTYGPQDEFYAERVRELRLPLDDADLGRR